MQPGSTTRGDSAGRMVRLIGLVQPESTRRSACEANQLLDFPSSALPASKPDISTTHELWWTALCKHHCFPQSSWSTIFNPLIPSIFRVFFKTTYTRSQDECKRHQYQGYPRRIVYHLWLESNWVSRLYGWVTAGSRNAISYQRFVRAIFKYVSFYPVRMLFDFSWRSQISAFLKIVGSLYISVLSSSFSRIVYTSSGCWKTYRMRSGKNRQRGDYPKWTDEKCPDWIHRDARCSIILSTYGYRKSAGSKSFGANEVYEMPISDTRDW
jgi:hypothetical protein